MSSHSSRRAALGVFCLAATLAMQAGARPQQAAAAPKHRNDAPLRFDPPAAGPAQRDRASYEACIEQPSPDGAAFDCQALLRPAATARLKPRPH